VTDPGSVRLSEWTQPRKGDARTMFMEIVFPQGDRVEAHSNGNVITTDQDGSAPTPFELFLASIGTCAGIYVSRFCRQRGLPTTDIRIRQTMRVDPATRMVAGIDLDIARRLP
jgi:putative redox protein